MAKKAATRQRMPIVSAWIDSLRAAFDVDAVDAEGKPTSMIDSQIRRGVKEGKPVFFASEGGQQLGTPIDLDPPGSRLVWDGEVFRREGKRGSR